MKKAGIDLGSRTVKLVVVENGGLILSRKALTSYDPLSAARELLADTQYDSLTATGYGRHIAKEVFGCPVISEIKAFATGAAAAFPGCRTVLDIGGQDTKAISLDGEGNLSKFEMNDKCAAGTGRFLEIMASALGFMMEDFAEAAMTAKGSVKINSMCTVFAESEVISLTAKGADRGEVALGIHRAIAARSVSLMRRIVIRGKIVFAGGVAFNRCVKSLIEQETGTEVLVPEDPQILGAIGCALSQGNSDAAFS